MSTLLSNYQDHQRVDHTGDDGNVGSRETSFVQARRRNPQLSRIRCYECGEFGHYARDCSRPASSSSNVQMDGNDEEEENSTTGSMRHHRRSGVAWSGSPVER